ncbi:PIN domain-containing protein [candidate division KSB1 bacterium]|nr:PIN domain-containing protein [candidate division KSB1 bacterium]
MTLEQVPSERMLFIDANILIYHFTQQSLSCSKLLRRCQDSEVSGFTSVVCVAEMLHRLMLAEAMQKGYVTPPNALRKLKENPKIVKKLDRYQEAPKRLLEMKITLLSATPEIVLRSKAIRKRYGLLTNDSLIITTMKMNRIKLLASNDGDFENISGIQLFKPSDL